MDLQGAGAIAAAAVAAASIPISTLVGRWQMRATLKTAETTYKAAVDTVKDQAAAAHFQWRRGVRRDTYSAFLLSVSRHTQQGFQVLHTGNNDPLDASTAISAMPPLYDDVMAKLVVVKLEGPHPVADAAAAVANSAKSWQFVCRRHALYQEAYAHAIQLRTAHEREVVEILRTADRADITSEDMREISNLSHSIGLDYAHLMRLCTRRVSEDQIDEAETKLNHRTEDFLRAAQAALDLNSD
ncbi:hypothetical protein [Streptomyces sp. NBC_01334]|uniref:hypothetical protein n=1 Tax=Streptomyces sp. NBC_01334 TaxID=2903827 RepID=UPI002E151402|nr:hypothetical protein OG736_45400 [Streptomyces sp. NBC_01334]